MAFNPLKLNGDKTEFIWIGSRRRLLQVQPYPLSVSGASVVPSNVVRNLGVYVDGELFMADNIKKLLRSCFFQLRQLRTIRRSLSKEANRLLLHAFVVNRLDYCSVHWTSVQIHRESPGDPKCSRTSLWGSGCVFRSESVLN